MGVIGGSKRVLFSNGPKCVIPDGLDHGSLQILEMNGASVGT